MVNQIDFLGWNTATVLGDRQPSLAPSRVAHAQPLLIGIFLGCLIAGSFIAFALPIETLDRQCAPSLESATVEFCIETRQYSQAGDLVAAVGALLTASVIAGAVAWRRWRRVVHANEPADVIDTLPRAMRRLRRRMALFALAALPLLAGLAAGGSTTSSFGQGELVCESRTFGTETEGVVTTVLACEQHSIEDERIVVTPSPWSWHLRLIGVSLLAGTAAWWIRAWRIERVLRKPEYSYVTLPNE